MNTKKTIKGYVITAIALLAMLGVSCSFSSKENNESNNITENKAGGIKWMTISEALKAQKNKPKKIFIDVYTDWCGWCKVMDKKTFTDAKVISYMNKTYYAVKLDAENDTKITEKYKGRELTHREFAHLLQVNSYPTTVFLDETGGVLVVNPGYVEAKDMDVILHFIGTDSFKTYTYAQYSGTYKAD